MSGAKRPRIMVSMTNALGTYQSEQEGERIDCFVIHRRPGVLAPLHGWTMTHEPTGYILAFFVYLRNARRAVKRLQRLDIDWLTLTVDRWNSSEFQAARNAVWGALEDLAE